MAYSEAVFIPKIVHEKGNVGKYYFFNISITNFEYFIWKKI